MTVQRAFVSPEHVRLVLQKLVTEVHKLCGKFHRLPVDSQFLFELTFGLIDLLFFPKFFSYVLCLFFHVPSRALTDLSSMKTAAKNAKFHSEPESIGTNFMVVVLYAKTLRPIDESSRVDFSSIMHVPIGLAAQKCYCLNGCG